MKNKRFRPIFFAAVAFSTASVNANTAIKAATGTDLTLAASWSGGSGPGFPTSIDVATWNASSRGAGLTIGSGTVNWGSVAITGAATDISITGTGTINTGNIMLSGDKTLTIASKISLSGNSIYNIGDVNPSPGGVDATLSGTVTGNGHVITKTGSGTLNIDNSFASGDSTIALNDGKLMALNCISTVNIGGSVAITGGYVTINSDINKDVSVYITGGLQVQNLTGQGTFLGGDVTINDTHNPGALAGNTLGVQTFKNNLTYEFWTDVNLEIDSLGQGFDSIVVGDNLPGDGLLTFGDSVGVSISLSGVASYGSTFWDSSHSFKLFTFETLSLEDGFEFWDLSDLGGNPSEGTWGLVQGDRDISAVWTVVPEPHVSLLGGLGLIALLRRRRNS